MILDVGTDLRTYTSISFAYGSIIILHVSDGENKTDISYLKTSRFFIT